MFVEIVVQNISSSKKYFIFLLFIKYIFQNIKYKYILFTYIYSHFK